MEKDQSDPLEFTGALSHPVPRGSRENDDEGPTIIIIDDDENFIESLSVVLRQNYKLILCKNGTEGVNSIHPGVHAVLLDIKMEGKDGFETFKEIKEKYLHIPIIFHSAYQDLKDPYELINEYRPFAYLTKEGNYSNLVNTIDSAVDYSRQLTQNRLLLDDLNMLTGRLREKVSELEHKKNLLKKYSSRVETLLACTNEMSSSADPLEGVKTAVRYILESLKVFRMANISVVLPETLGSYKAAYQCRQIVKFGRLLEHDISLGLSESELELLDKTNGIELNDSTLHIPVVNDSQKLACLLITNIESDTPDEEEIEFINGIIKSLSSGPGRVPGVRVAHGVHLCPACRWPRPLGIPGDPVPWHRRKRHGDSSALVDRHGHLRGAHRRADHRRGAPACVRPRLCRGGVRRAGIAGKPGAAVTPPGTAARRRCPAGGSVRTAPGRSEPAPSRLAAARVTAVPGRRRHAAW